MVLSRFAHTLTRLLPLLLFTFAVRAQRAADRPPAADPFGRRAVLARAVPGGRYRSHQVFHDYDTTKHEWTRLMLEVQATDGSIRRIQTWAPGVVKISYFAPGQRPVADSSLSVVQPPQPVAYETYCNHGCDGPPPTEMIKRYGPNICSGVYVYPDKLAFGVNCQGFELDKKTLAIKIHGHSLGEQPLLSEAVTPFCRQPTTQHTGDIPPSRIDELAGTGVRFHLQPSERLYGTGSRALPLDRRGYRLELYNQAHYGSQNGEPNLNIALPVVLSSRGYLLLFDHYAAGYLDLGKTDKNVLEYGGEGLTSLSYFVVTGRDQAEILDRYTALTGRQPLPPRWALGLIQSRFGYKSSEEVSAVATRMRRENFPLDALVLDLYWFGGTTRQGDFAWDKSHFPDPAGLMAGLKKQNINTILILEPYVMRTSRNDSAVRTQGLVGTDAQGRPFTVGSFWAGPASILDMFKPSARRWLWDRYKTLHDQGAAGWWSDLGEPENHPDAMRHALGPTRAVHNAYGQAWASIFQENYAKDYPDERVFNLARSGWAGMQRNGVFPWSGDVNRSWSGLQAQVPVMLGLGQAGVGYMHSDAGGFCVGPIDPELYTRWLQMASLCPILRIHGEGVPPEPYFFPDPYKNSVRDAVHLRYKLLPYLYSLAYENSLTGAPLARSMDFEGRHPFLPSPFSPPANYCDADQLSADEKAAGFTPDESDRSNDGWGPAISQRSAATVNPALANLNDQYLLGPDLLVAPVLQPSQRRRNVVLPAGPWIDFYTNQNYAGGQTVAVPAPLAHSPLLVRAGAFVPMTAYRPSTAQYRPDTLLLPYYPDSAVPHSGFTVFDDDGHSAQTLTRQQYQALTVRGIVDNQQIIVRLHRAGHYPGQAPQQVVQLLVQRVAPPPTAVQFGGQQTPDRNWRYDAALHELTVDVLLTDTATVRLPGLRLLASPAPFAKPETLTLEAPDQRSFGPGSTALHYVRLENGVPELLLIRDARGAAVRQLVLDSGAGPHTLPFDGRDARGQPLPPGVYTAEAAGQHQRLILTE